MARTQRKKQLSTVKCTLKKLKYSALSCFYHAVGFDSRLFLMDLLGPLRCILWRDTCTSDQNCFTAIENEIKIRVHIDKCSFCKSPIQPSVHHNTPCCRVTKKLEIKFHLIHLSYMVVRFNSRSWYLSSLLQTIT